MADCPKCRREIVPNHAMHESPLIAGEWCWGMGAYACDIAADAYRRGIDEGVRLAKAGVRTEVVYVTCRPPTACIDWTDVDAAAEKAKGGSHG